MKKRMILALPPLACCAFQAAAAPASLTPSSAEGKGKPNIIMFLLDDFGYGDIGAFRELYVNNETTSEAWKLTGNLDRFAEEGIRFTRAYACAWSAPARQMLLSGLWTNRESMYDQPWLGKRLRDQGYRTAMFGKSHGNRPTVKCYADRNPETAEFDEGLFFNGGCRNAYVKDGEVFKGRTALDQDRNYTTHKGEHLTDIWTEHAIDFIERHAGEEQPFFIYLAHTTPHEPLQGKPGDLKALYPEKYGKMTDMEIIDRWKREVDNDEHFNAMIYGVNRTFGNLVRTLEETGELDNTIILFASDNGGRHGSCYPLHGHKSEPFEGGIRTPLFVWSSKIAASEQSGKVYDGMVTLADIAPTLAAIAGEKEGTYKSDGCDMREYILRNEPMKDKFYFYSGLGRPKRHPKANGLDDYEKFFREKTPDRKRLMHCTYIKNNKKIISMQSQTMPELHSLAYFEVPDAVGTGRPVNQMYEEAAPYGEYPGNPEAMALYQEMLQFIADSDGDIDLSWSGENPNIHFQLPETYKPEKGWNQTEDKIYAVRDGLELHLEVVRNTRWKGQRPTIVFYSGGGWNNCTINMFRLQANELAEKGMTAILVDYRTTRNGKAEPWQCVEDAKSVMRYVKTHAKELGVNPKKIVASGGSAGGHLAAATAYVKAFDHPDDDLSVSPVPAALALFNPVVDNGPDGYGYDRVKAYWEKFSPLHNIQDGKALPTLVMVGDQDKVVPLTMIGKFGQKTEANGAPFTLKVYEGQGHGFFHMKVKGNPYYQETLEDLEDFLAKLHYLKK